MLLGHEARPTPRTEAPCKPSYQTRSAIVAAALAISAAAVGCGANSDAADTSEVDVAALRIAQAQLPEGPPDEYVTKAGRFHRSCVHPVEDGDEVDGQGGVFRHGALVARHERCQFKGFRAHHEGGDSGLQSPNINGWSRISRRTQSARREDSSGSMG